MRHLVETFRLNPPVRRLWRQVRRQFPKSWTVSRLYYRWYGVRLHGRPAEPVWYFAYGANMHDSAFRERRGMRPSEWHTACLKGYRLRFNLEGRPPGRAAPANLCADGAAEVWGVCYRITRRELLRLDSTEGVPGRRGYRHVSVLAEDGSGRLLPAITYMAAGKPDDGKPSLRYITLLREGARAHGLPPHYIAFLDAVEPAG
jgi:cation transport regulator ChaC